MNKTRIVVACFGDLQSAAMIKRLAWSAEVIAVAFDLGGAVSLPAMRESAIAAGALRCHALDVREEFAREILIPASQSWLFDDPVTAIECLAAPFVAGKLQEIANAEDASCVLPDRVDIPQRPLAPPPTGPLCVEIEFSNGLPVAVNGVAMSLTELMESLETITGQPAFCVLRGQRPSPDHQIA